MWMSEHLAGNFNVNMLLLYLLLWNGPKISIISSWRSVYTDKVCSSSFQILPSFQPFAEMLPFCLPQHLCCPTFYPRYATYVACSFKLSLLLWPFCKKSLSTGPGEQGYVYCYIFWLLIQISSPFHGRKVHHDNSPDLLAQTLAKWLLLAEPADSIETSADRPEVPDTEIVKSITRAVSLKGH